MKKNIIIAFCLFFLQIVSFGQNLIQNGNFESGVITPFSLWFSSAAYQSTMTISSQNPHLGTKSLLIDVLQTDPANTNYYDKIWRVQSSQSGIAATEGDKLLLSFWARSNAPHQMQFGIARNSGDYEDFAMEEIDVTTAWKKYEMIFVSPITTTNDLRIIFKCGTSVGQYFLDDISFTHEGTIDQNWYADADQRIEQIRKGNFTVTAKDATGALMPNCEVTLDLKQHDFKWGTALAFNTNLSADEMWYRNTAASYFNNAVFENDFKWPSMEYTNGNVSHIANDRYLDWGVENNISFRGHTLVWGGRQASPPNTYFLTPYWLWNVSSDSAYKLIERRVKRDVTYYKGRIKEYDVVNEPVHEKALAAWLGDSVHVMAFKWAKEADPSAALYINDYANIDGGSTSAYKAYIKYLLSKGAPVEGIGLQGHFGDYINWKTVKLRLDYLADLNLPMKITEFDMNVNTIGMTEQDQANEYAKMMRIAFSHPNVEAFLFWGFWDARHWIPGAGIYNTDKTPKIAADSVYNLIHSKWTTSITGTTDQNGQLNFRGFYGTYTVRAGGCAIGKYAETLFTKTNLENTVVLDLTTTNIVQATKASVLVAYPNPTKNTSRVVLSSPEGGKSHYVILNTSGQVVQTKTISLNTGENTIDVDLSGFKPGVYEFKIEHKGNVYTSKIVKSN